jgi:hypothetical protein
MGFAWVNGDGRYDVLLADLPPLPGPASGTGLRQGRVAVTTTAGRRGRHAIPPRGLRGVVMAGRSAQGPVRLVIWGGSGSAGRRG